MFKVVIDTFQFAAVFALSALLTVLTLTARDVRPDRRKAILSLFCFLSLYSLSEIGWSTGALHRAIGWLSMAMPLLAGPILLWSARAGAARPFRLTLRKALPHLIPFLLCLGLTRRRRQLLRPMAAALRRHNPDGGRSALAAPGRDPSEFRGLCDGRAAAG